MQFVNYGEAAVSLRYFDTHLLNLFIICEWFPAYRICAIRCVSARSVHRQHSVLLVI